MSNFRSEMMANDLDEPGILGHLGTQNFPAKNIPKVADHSASSLVQHSWRPRNGCLVNGAMETRRKLEVLGREGNGYIRKLTKVNTNENIIFCRHFSAIPQVS